MATINYFKIYIKQQKIKRVKMIYWKSNKEKLTHHHIS